MSIFLLLVFKRVDRQLSNKSVGTIRKTEKSLLIVKPINVCDCYNIAESYSYVQISVTEHIASSVFWPEILNYKKWNTT